MKPSAILFALPRTFLAAPSPGSDRGVNAAERALQPPLNSRAEYMQAVLTPAQHGMLESLTAHFSGWEYQLPAVEPSKGYLTEEEKFWLSQECLLRYLRASKWKQETAIKCLEDTLKWRRDFGLYDTLSAQHVEPEAVTGKLIVDSFDVEGRVGYHMHPSRQNQPEGMRQMEFAVWMLERCTDLMGPGVETITVLLDFADRDKTKKLSLFHAKTFLSIFQTHYPERLGYSLILNVPFVVTVFFKLISPFIDPASRAKMVFNPRAVEDGYFARDAISEAWGGDREFTYDHDTYWPALQKICAERRAGWMARWRELGGTVGIREWDYKSGFEIDVGPK